MPTSEAHEMSSVAHSYSAKWPISGSAKVGENSCPYAVSRVKNSSPKETMTNQCATATTGSRDIRVWPRNSRTSVRVRVAGCPVRVGSAWPRRKTDTRPPSTLAKSATATAVTARHRRSATICRAGMLGVY